MRIQLSDHFTYSKLLRFTLPSMIMMVFTSIYGVVDGVFVSNFVGKTPFAALNLIYPYLMILGAEGFMIGTGGSAVVSMTLGRGDKALANRYFSLMVYAAAIGGAVVSLLAMLALPWVAARLGAEGQMLEDCILYGRIILAFNPCFMLQNVFQSFFVTAEKPKLGLYATVGAGLTNMVLDALLVGVFPLGLAGAALATGISQAVGALVPIFYFARKNDSILRLGSTGFYGAVLLKACGNGSSELLSNICSSMVSMLYNLQLMRLAGEDGVAAYGVIMYVSFIFAAISIGYAVGSAPVVGFHYGAENSGELKSLLGKSVRLTAGAGIAMAVLAAVLSAPLSKIFVSYDQELLQMTIRGFRVYAFSFLFVSFNIFASSFFTALGNGGVSALISALRTLVFQCVGVLILPILLELDGVWLAVVAAEAAACAVSVLALVLNRKVYRY